MNKRDFIVQSGGTLLAGAACWPAMGRTMSMSSSNDASTAPAALPPGPPRQHQDWQALQGLVFDAHTALGRPVPLLLSEVRARERTSTATTALQQFTVTLQGPRGLPLPAGLHVLHHPDAGHVALYLEPVQRDEQIAYDAHFSLTI